MVNQQDIDLVCSGYSPQIRRGLQRGLERGFRNLQLNVRPDKLDDRDLVYQPGLVEIKPHLDAPAIFAADSVDVPTLTRQRRKLIRRQGSEGSCTGQALAAAIDIQNLLRSAHQHDSTLQQLMENDKLMFDRWFQNRVSARMLYEMARALDENPEDRIPGSSVRNVLKGFRQNGVCSEKLAPYLDDDVNWSLTLDQAKDARSRRLGAYFRLNPVAYDYHAALNEVGVILVSAMIHDGWDFSRGEKVTDQNSVPYRKISFDSSRSLKGGHAFVIIGYTDEGFLILNSWGSHWGLWEEATSGATLGTPGVALWSYEDWRAHVLDTWVFRLGIYSEKAIQPHAGFGRHLDPATGKPRSRTPRLEVNGHYLHLKQGKFVRNGSLPNNGNTFITTRNLLQERLSASLPDTRVYRDLVLIFNHGFQRLDSHVSTIASHIRLLKQSSVYPIFIYWPYGQINHVENLITASLKDVYPYVGSSDAISQRYIEKYLHDYSGYFFANLMSALDQTGGRPLPSPVASGQLDLYKALAYLLKLAGEHVDLRVHFIAHGDGAMLMERFLTNVTRLSGKGVISEEVLINCCESISLLAPIVRRKDLPTTESTIKEIIRSGRKKQIELVTLGQDDEINDYIGAYSGSYARLAQQIYFPRFERYAEDEIIGLHDHACRLNKSPYYRHIAYPMRSGKGYFGLLNEICLVRKLLKMADTAAKKSGDNLSTKQVPLSRKQGTNNGEEK